MIEWSRLDPTSDRASYAVEYIDSLQPPDLRDVILRFDGRLAPEGLDRDKLAEWAGYAFLMKRHRATGTQPTELFMHRHAWATDPNTPAMHNHHRRRAEKARRSFERLANREPSPSSAMGMAYAILDEKGDIGARKLLQLLVKRRKKTVGLNSVRSYLSCWRRKQKEARKEAK